MNAIDRHRMQYRQNRALLEEMLGDSSTTALTTGALSELLATAGKAGAQYQQGEEAKKKAADDATKTAAEQAAHDKLVADAKQKRAQATQDANAARVAALKAQAEKEPYGPLHIAAQNAADKAAMSDQVARNAEADAGLGARTSLQTGEVPHAKKSGGMPWWGWALIGTAVAGVGTAVTVKLVRR